MEKINILKKISDFVYEIAKFMTIFYISGVLIIVLTSVLLRMVGKAPSWSEELARWLLIGTAYIGASVALKEKTHIGITIIVKSLKSFLLKKILLIASNVLVLIFLLFLTYSGADAAIKAVDQMGDIVKMPMMLPKLNIPLGSLFMTIHIIYNISLAFTTNNLNELLLSD